MENFIIKEFNGAQIYTLMWNDKPCWIATQIVSIFGYVDPSTTIGQCIEAEQFEIGVEYDILKSSDLKEFKKMINSLTKVKLVSQNTPHLVIFYEDGLYGFLQYTDKPIGVQFRKWIRRDVIPEIRQTGAYITNKANPEALRTKADEIERLDTINKSLELVSPLLDAVGIDSNIKLLVTKTLFAKAGINIPIEIEAEERYYDTKQIGYILGIYSKAGKPAFGAVGEIIKQLDIAENEKKAVWESNGAWQGTVIKYTRSVIDKVEQWIKDNGKPIDIPSKNKTFHVVYKELEGGSILC